MRGLCNWSALKRDRRTVKSPDQQTAAKTKQRLRLSALPSSKLDVTRD